MAAERRAARGKAGGGRRGEPVEVRRYLGMYLPRQRWCSPATVPVLEDKCPPIVQLGD